MENLVPDLSKMKAIGFGCSRLEVGSVPVEENGQIIHYGRNCYAWDAETDKWVLKTVYDDMNHKWVDVNH